MNISKRKIFSAAALGGLFAAVFAGRKADGQGIVPSPGNISLPLSQANGGTGYSLLPTDHVSTIAALQSYSGTSNCITVDNYSYQGDFGGGVFFWNSVSTATTDSGTIFNSSSRGSTGRWLRIYAKNFLNAAWYGCDPTGTVDNTTLIQSMLAIGGTLYFPAGSYLITPGILAIQSNSFITGDGPTKTIFTQNGTVSARNYFFSATSVNNISVIGCGFIGSSTLMTALLAMSSSQINMSACYTTNCSLYGYNIQPYTYASVTYSTTPSSSVNMNFFVKLDHCNGTGDGLADNSFINIQYTYGTIIADCWCYNFDHGIFWYGGDANPVTGNGAPGATLKCGNIVVERCTVLNMVNGGIWGSMGQQITVKDNHVDTCGDVGIDFEGCSDCLAFNNSITQCSNGCLTLFNYCSNITFEKNYVYNLFTSGTWIAGRVYSATSLSDYCSNIRWIDNYFYSPSILGVLDANSGPFTEGLVQDNEFLNVYVNMVQNDMGAFRAISNKFEFNLSGNPTFYAIAYGPNGVTSPSVPGNYAEIRDNVMIVNGTNTNATGIYIFFVNYNNSPTIDIRDNTITNFPSAINLNFIGSATAATCMVRRNKIVNGAYSVTNSASPAAAIIIKDNVDGVDGIWSLTSTVSGTVSSLPSASVVQAGSTGYVTDSTLVYAGNVGSTVTGGGTHAVPVKTVNGSWVIG